MIEKGADYSFAEMPAGRPRMGVLSRVCWRQSPRNLSCGWDTRIFLFGPGLLPDSDFRRESIAPANGGGRGPNGPLSAAEA